MTVLSRRLLFFSIFFFVNIEAWPSSQEENYGQSNENKEQKMEKYLKEKEIENATLFNTSEPLDDGQLVLEKIYQMDRYIKFEVGFNWTGREILCNCTTVSCGPEMVVSLLEQVGYSNTCIAQSCFHKKGVLKNKITGVWERYETLGCYGGDSRTHPIHNVIEPFMCADGPHVPIRCCWKSFCNSNLSHIFDYPDAEKLEGESFISMRVRVVLGVGGALFSLGSLFYCIFTRRRWIRTKWLYKLMNRKYPGESDGFPLMDLTANRFSTPVYPNPYEQLQNESGGTTMSIGTEMTSIDGSHPLNKLLRDLDESETFGFSSGAMGDLVQKNSFLSDIQRIEYIGQGRYGTVFRCIWKGQTVAMKVLISRYEQSYYREVSMYRSGILRHTNILQFLGNDIIEHGSALEMCMVFEYHELGSLDNYLYSSPVDVPTAAKMMYSMASGLAFLHSAMETSAQMKPAIAHRDLKSGNILVKKNLMVCISDLGLAICQVEGRIGIPKPSENDHFEIEYKRRSEKMEKCGTMRYLSPELLDDTFDCDIFECYKAADVYSLGLVMYEVCRRTITEGEPEIPYDQAMPYFRQIAENGGIVGEVDFTIMKKVIVDDRERPDMCDWWAVDPILQPLTHLMVECWQEDPQARLTANNLVRSIARAAEKEGLDISQT